MNWYLSGQQRSVKQDLDMLEIFCGAGHLHKAFAAAGLAAEGLPTKPRLMSKTLTV